MKSSIMPFNWRDELNKIELDSIGNDFILLENPIITSVFDYPFKVDVTTAIINIRGTMKGTINLKPYVSEAPCLTIVLPDKILEYEYISDDFSGLFIVMSRRFTENLNLQERVPLLLSVQDNPSIPLREEELKSITDYFYMLQRAVKIKENPHRMELAKHLTMAFFYGFGYWHHKSAEEKKSKQDILIERFLNDVQIYYKEQRGMDFYADRLCLTPKYLSKVLKDNSGLSASDWIDSYVILEAKALLKSTNMTIQQISDELNFPSQSFFGKYFKRNMGVSPKEYRV